MNNYSTRELEEMLIGLEKSLEVFRSSGDREAIYAAKGHIRRIKIELFKRNENY